MQLLHSFTTLQTLFVSGNNVEDVSLALDGDMTNELLPVLDLLGLESKNYHRTLVSNSVKIAGFLAAR